MVFMANITRARENRSRRKREREKNRNEHAYTAKACCKLSGNYRSE